MGVLVKCALVKIILQYKRTFLENIRREIKLRALLIYTHVVSCKPHVQIVWEQSTVSIEAVD